jgi:hypothetical protein
MTSLQKIHAAGLQIALPGHGEIIENVQLKSQQILETISTRRKKILGFLHSAADTPIEISLKLFPDMTPISLFNAVNDVMAHLELLEEDGLIRKVSERPSRYCLL